MNSAQVVVVELIKNLLDFRLIIRITLVWLATLFFTGAKSKVYQFK